MKIFGVAGFSGSGKTTLLIRLLPELIGRGLSVSTVKHAHHGFDVDQPGKDSFAHRAAGAREVMVSSANRWALMHELSGEAEPRLETLVGHMTPVDLLLVEGFKREGHPKLEVHRVANSKPLLAPEDPTIVALASDQPIAGIALPRFTLDDVVGIADFIMRASGIARRSAAQS